MSWEALTWATKQKAGSSTSKLVLLMLANCSNDFGTSFPSRRYLSTNCECSLTTIERAIKNLERLGLITVEHRFQKDTKGGNRQTSNLYTLNITPLVNMLTPLPNNNEGPLRKNAEPITYNNKPNNKEYSKEFLLWWQTYPRKDGSKAKAFQLWLKTIDKEIESKILQKVTETFTTMSKGTEKQYIPHATTWLNQKRYETVVVKQRNKTLIAG